MASETLFDVLTWRQQELPNDAAASTIPLRIADVGRQGPLATIVAGVHGDEGPWGALAIRALLRHPVETLRGRLRIMFAANPLAAAADARNAPLDHLDLNRVFPGQPAGSHTERLAAAIAAELGDSDVVVDLHGGGSWCVNAFTFRFPGFEDLAALAGAPFVVDVDPKPGGLTEHALRHGARILAVEMGGRSRDEMAWRDRITAGLERILQHSGVLDLPDLPAVPAAPVTVTGMQVLRPATGGLFVPTLREEAIGTDVPVGTELGVLLDLNTLAPLERFTAPYDRTALMLLRPHVCRLEGGAMTYVVAEVR